MHGNPVSVNLQARDCRAGTGVLTMDDAKLAKAVELIQEKMAGQDAFGSTVRFDFGDGSAILVDGNESPPRATPDAETDADCTITAEEDTFRELIEGELDPTAAFMTGKIKIDGSMGAAMAISRVLG